MLKDPKAATEQALRMVRDGEIVARQRQAHQGRRPHAVRARRRGDGRCGGARRSEKALEDAGIAVVPLTEMKL